MRWTRLSVLALVSALLLLLQASGLANQGAQTPATQRYIVGLRPGAEAMALVGPDAQLLFNWPGLNAMAIQANLIGLNRLQRDRRIAYIEADHLVYKLDHDDPSAGDETTWGLDDVHAVTAWATTKGDGVGVCVIDSGIDFNHPDFIRNGLSIVAESKNFNGDGKATAQDGQGHGTHVAGIIAAVLDGSGVVGVSPEVQLYVARIAGDSWSGVYTSTVVEALNWCADRADIFNMSYGSDLSNRTEQIALQNAYDRGRLLIAASGNSGTTRVSYPAAYSTVVAVGALNPNNTLASFSQYGKDQELSAPGVGILSTVPLGYGLMGSASEDGVEYAATPLEFSAVDTISDAPLVECGLSNSETSCNGAPASDWIALIDCGEITFAEKVSWAMQQGAKAAIIANNDSANPDDIGTFTLGTDSLWVPSVAVSYNSGQAIRSGLLGAGTVQVGASDYAQYDGTSMAAPHAVGVAALAWAANRSLTNLQIRQVLRDSAKDLSVAGRDKTFGYGLVQAHAAVAAALATDGGGGSDGPKNINLVVTAGGPYRANDRVNVAVMVTQAENGLALGSAKVTIAIKNPSGVVVASGSATTGSNGVANFQWKSKTNSPKGTYSVQATATKDGYNSAVGVGAFQLE